MEVAVSAVEHGVVGERWKLGDGGIEGDGEAAGGIVGAGEDVGERGAAFFARIPGFENRGSVIVGPIDGESAATGEYDDERFTGGGKSLEELLLRGGETDVGAIAAEEAGIAIFTLLTFEVGSDADDGDDNVGFASEGSGFLNKVRRKPEEPSEGLAEAAEIFEAYGIRMTGLKVKKNGEGALPAVMVLDPIVDDLLVVEVEAVAAVGDCPDAVVAIDWRNKFTGPADGEVIRRDAGAGRDVVGGKVDGRIDAGERGGAGKSGIREELSVHAGFGVGAASAEIFRRNRQRARLRDGRAGGEGDDGVGEVCFYAVEEGGVGGRSAVVIAEKDVEGIGGGADDGDRFDVGFERESVVIVFEKDDGFVRGLERELTIFGGVDVGEGEFGPGHVGGRIEHAEAEACFEEAADGAIDVAGCQEAVHKGVVEGAEFGATGEVGARFDGESGSLRKSDNEIVGLVEIADGPTVGNDVAFEAPLVSKQIEEKMIGAGGFAVDGVVRAHDGVGAALDDGSAEGRRVGVVEIVGRYRNIETVAQRFGSGVDGVVLGRGDRFQIVWVVALQASDKGNAEAAGEEGIFAVGFLAASPARIAKDVDVWRPESETKVAAGVVEGDGVIVFGTGFGGDDAGDAVEKIAVPAGGEADPLGENGGVSSARDAMKAFVPPVVSGDVEMRNGGSDVLHLGDFFFGGHARKEIVDALLERERRIEVGRGGCGSRLRKRESG